MGDFEKWGWPPTGAPLYIQKDDHWRHFDSSVNAVSFGFVATAILISMFLVMAIFERFLRPQTPALTPVDERRNRDIESQQLRLNAKLAYASPKVSSYAKEVPVVMPGELIPTFIANPAPVPCSPERMQWPAHQHSSLPQLDTPTSSIGMSTSART
ncbi:hypothetical protein Leryth_027563 [Lithospermum erythrorhizon]|nr:hypothetical protein Leryth_027563 [Lithospermum erythrorhizon]